MFKTITFLSNYSQPIITPFIERNENNPNNNLSIPELRDSDVMSSVPV